MNKDEDEELEALLSEFDDPLPGKTGMTKSVVTPAPKKRGAIKVSAGITQPTKVMSAPPEITDDDIQPEALANNIRRLLARYRGVAEEVLDNCRSDREQAQSVIDHFFAVIDGSEKVPTVYVEKFPDLLRTKNEIGATAVRLLGELTKLVSASKGSDILGKVDVNIDMQSLLKLLENEDE